MLQHGKMLGGMLLVAGSCIGAGMLAMPIIMGMAGFIPSLFAFLLVWLFMTFTALLLVEANGWFKGQINIISMAGKAFGKKGKAFAWLLYLFLFYALLVAYISGSGGIFVSLLDHFLSIKISPQIASTFFTICLGFVIYFGTRPVDFCNRVFMVGLLITYCSMVYLGLSKIDIDFLSQGRWGYFLLPLPVLITAFGFHNMIPTLTAYLNHDLRKMRITVIGGGLIALACYVIWLSLVVGVIPFEGPNGIAASYYNQTEAAQALGKYLGKTQITLFSEGFAFFAIVTSFIAQALTLSHFIADGLKVALTKVNRIWLTLMVLVPSFIFASLNPEIFFDAINFAGGVCAVLLFGILPVCMVWKGRYVKSFPSDYHVNGGKTSLILAAIVALVILTQAVVKISYL